MKKTNGRCRQANVWYALSVIIGILILIVGGNKLIDAPIEAMFLVSWLAVYPACMFLGYSYQEINEGVAEGCREGLSAVLALLVVGAIVSTWIASGTVPAIIYYGLRSIQPDNFLLVTFVLCCCMSFVSGTAWGTMGTVGVAMFAVGATFDFPPGMTVGAIVSGACIGNMGSPMSGSPHVAAPICEISILTHCKQLIKTSTPVIILCAIFYYCLGQTHTSFTYENNNGNLVSDIEQLIASRFDIGTISFLPITLLIVLLTMNQPAILSMLASSVSALGVAVLHEGIYINNAMNIFWNGYSVETGNSFLDEMLNRGGVISMASSSLMVLFACGIVGAIEKAGILDALVTPTMQKVHTIPRLALVSQLVTIFGSLMGTNSFALLMAGRLLLPLYKKFNIDTVNLSKIICVTSVSVTMLVPWNASCVYVVNLFCVNVGAFAPYAILSYLLPATIFLCDVMKPKVSQMKRE